MSFMPVLTIGYFARGAVNEGRRAFRAPLGDAARAVLAEFADVPMTVTDEYIQVRWFGESTPLRVRALVAALHARAGCEVGDLGHRHIVSVASPRA